MRHKLVLVSSISVCKPKTYYIYNIIEILPIIYLY